MKKIVASEKRAICSNPDSLFRYFGWPSVARLQDGTLAMARSSMPDSAGSQFYFCLGPQPFLDSDYTVFGQTIEGLDVIAKLRAGDVIEHIEIENAIA